MSSAPVTRVGVGRLSAVLPGIVLVALLIVPLTLLVSSWQDGTLAIDFWQTFLPAAERLLDGDSPYPALGYPPLVAFLSVPLALLPSPELAATVVVAACVPAALWFLGVRDWRCYVVAFLWASVYHGVQTANVTLPMLLGASICWRWRDRLWATAVSGGLTIALKIIAWPLAFWLAVSGRFRAAAGAVVVAVGVTFALWAAVGFSELTAYPDSLDRQEGLQGERGYTFQALAADAGLADEIGLAASLACLALVLFAVLLYARRGDEERSFACACVAVIVGSPIVWLHSFAFLLGPVALLRPRLSLIWFLPVAHAFVAVGNGNGAPWQTVVTMAGAAVFAIVVLAPPRPAYAVWRARLGARAS